MSFLLDKLKQLEAAAIALCRRGAGPLGRFVRPPGQPGFSGDDLDTMGASDGQRRIVDQVAAMDATIPPPEAGP